MLTLHKFCQGKLLCLPWDLLRAYPNVAHTGPRFFVSSERLALDLTTMRLWSVDITFSEEIFFLVLTGFEPVNLRFRVPVHIHSATTLHNVCIQMGSKKTHLPFGNTDVVENVWGSELVSLVNILD